MNPRLLLLLIMAFAWFGWAAIDGLQGTAQRAFAQPPSGSPGSDRSGRDDNRDRSRGRFGDRGRGDWRSSRSRGDEDRRGEKRGDERAASNGSPSTSSGSTSSSSRSASSTTPAPATSTSTSSTTTNVNLQSWATSLVKQHDKNGNMILEPDEQGFLGTSAAGEDLNHDGKITIDELVMHHSAGGAVASPPASTATSSASTVSTSTGTESARSTDRDRERFREGVNGRHDGGTASDSQPKTDDPTAKRVLTGTAGGTSKDANKRHSYRFSKASDKLPTGLPSWFASRDTNGDGQVSMSEYSRNLSQSVVAEFRRYDTNDDGFITAKEAAKQK